MSSQSFKQIFTSERKTALLGKLDRTRYSESLAKKVLGITGIINKKSGINKAATKRKFFNVMNNKYPIMTESSILKAADTSTDRDNRMSVVKQFFKGFAGRQISAVIKDPQFEWFSSFTGVVPVQKFKKWFNENIAPKLFPNSADMWGDGEGGIHTQWDTKATIKITPATFLSNASAQTFGENTKYTCMIKPVIEWAGDYLQTKQDAYNRCKDKKKKTALNLQKEVQRRSANYDRALALTTMYPLGIPQGELQSVVSDLNIGFEITLPLHKKNEDPLIRVQANNPRRWFKFINNRFDHVQTDDDVREQRAMLMSSLDNKIRHIDDFVEIGENTTVTQVEMQRVLCECVKKNVFYISTGKQNELSTLSFKDTRLVCESPYKVAALEWMTKWGINNKSCQLLDGTLEYDFAKEGTHSVITVDFRDETTLALCKTHIDMKAAYSNCKSCTRWVGFAECMTDIRQTNKFEGVGIYRVECIDFSKVDEKVLRIMKMLNLFNMKYRKLDDSFTAPCTVLKYFQSMGLKFDVVCGMWTQKPHMLTFHDNESAFDDMSAYPMMTKYNGIKHYSKFNGICQLSNGGAEVSFPATKEYAEVVNKQYIGRVQHYKNDTQEYATVSFPKKTHHNRQHHFAQTSAYMQLMMVEQLLTMDMSQVIRICVDGIYTEQTDVECVNIFSHKPVDMSKLDNQCLNTKTRCSYLAPSPLSKRTPTDAFPKPREQYTVVVETGAGGTGKTYDFTRDIGLINKIVVAPSHKLATEIRIDGKVDTCVLARALHPDSERHEILHDHACIFFDEVSQYNNDQKNNILQLYNTGHRRIIFGGDIGYQLPCIKGVEFEIGSLPSVEFKKNYRNGGDEVLTKVLTFLRDMIEQTNGTKFNRNHAMSAFNQFYKKCNGCVMDEAGVRETYSPTDIVLSYTHQKDEKSMEEAYALNGNKWYMQKATSDHQKGDIVLSTTQPKHSVSRHVYTTHCVQGVTFDNTIYIDMHRMACTNDCLRLIYTALSRARRFEQIVLVTDELPLYTPSPPPVVPVPVSAPIKTIKKMMHLKQAAPLKKPTTKTPAQKFKNEVYAHRMKLCESSISVDEYRASFKLSDSDYCKKYM